MRVTLTQVTRIIVNNFHKIFIVVAILVSFSYSHAADYECNLNHPGVSHAEAHGSAHLNNSIIISQPNVEYSLFNLMARRILKEAYARIGEDIDFEILPIERSVELANNGVTDGELARISGLQKVYPNLIQVPVSIASVEVFVYSKNHNFLVKDWQSLKPYKIDHLFGFKYAEQKSKGLNATTVKTNYQGLNKLNANRSDLYVGILGVTCSMNKLNFTDIKLLTPALDKVAMYHYLHKRNKHIADRLEVVLNQMKQNGELQLMQKEVKQAFLKQCS